jgi:lysophospholipase L1-like esterase
MARILLCTLLLLILASCAAPESGVKESTPEPADEPLTYVSLGDSLAVGVGASDPRARGYTPLYREELARQTGREVRLVQLGVSGETSESFVGGYPNAESSQLARAVRTLEENPAARVTLSLGGNDLLRTAELSDPAREATLLRYAQNLDYILQELSKASDPAPRITVLALYNPAPGSFTDVWVGRLNSHIRAAAEEHGADVAAGDRAFRGHEEEYAHYARYPWDIHPTDGGYEALARAFAEATKSSA